MKLGLLKFFVIILKATVQKKKREHNDPQNPLFNGRGGSSSNSITVGERLLSTLLTEMDGLEQSKVSANHMIMFSIYLKHILAKSLR